MTQPSLFDVVEREKIPPHQSHSVTSKCAAVAIVSESATLREEVRKHLVACGEHGATDEEIQNALGMNPSTQRPRRIELVQRGIVEDSGTTRKTTSGRSATVWKMK
jgi:DNA-directed RNA polymerase specialized sigma24 family protein